jgi:hypothetical protein
VIGGFPNAREGSFFDRADDIGVHEVLHDNVGCEVLQDNVGRKVL